MVSGIPPASSPSRGSASSQAFFNQDMLLTDSAWSKKDQQDKLGHRFILAKDIQKYESERMSQLNNQLLQVPAPDRKPVLQHLSPQLQSHGSSISKLPLVMSSTPHGLKVISPKAINVTPVASALASSPPSVASFTALNQTNSIVNLNPRSRRASNAVFQEKNIFATGQKQINPQMYKEFNIGPRTDTNGKIVQYTLVGNPQWFTKQRDLIEKANINKARGVVQQNRDTLGKSDEESSSKGRAKRSNNVSQSGKQPQSDKSIGSLRRIDTAQSVVVNRGQNSMTSLHQSQQQHQQQGLLQLSQASKKKKRNDSMIEAVTKDEVIKEFEDIEKRHAKADEVEKRTLKQMSLDMRNVFTRDERVLQRHNDHLSDWDSQINRVARISERQPVTSCMLRGEEHRRKVELVQAYDNLKTEEERFGKRIWYMYLRKYSREKNATEADSNGEGIGHHRGKQLQSGDGKGPSNTLPQEELDSTQKTKSKQKPKLRELIDTNENTQSDIFSGFMTVTIHNHNKEIEVIRKTQDPREFHLSSVSSTGSGISGAFRKNSTRYSMESIVKNQQGKLRNTMIFLEQPIDDFIVVGSNKLQSEKNAVIRNKSNYFEKVSLQTEPEILNYGSSIKEKESFPMKSYSLQQQQQQQVKPSQTQVIESDYNLSELSKTGHHFFPEIIQRIQQASPTTK